MADAVRMCKRNLDVAILVARLCGMSDDNGPTIEQRVAALEAQSKRGKWITETESDLRTAALRYARLVKFRVFIDHAGQRVTYCVADADELADYYARQMQSAAMKLVLELSMEGE